MTTSTLPEPPGLVHSALFYRSQKEYLDAVVPFILDGLRKAEPVLVAVPSSNLVLLRDALGDASAQVTLADIAELGRNPAQILGVEGAFLAKHSGPVRMVGEVVWPGRSDDEYPACVEHEALVNAAFAGSDLVGLCPYDAAGLHERVLADARATHPLLWRDGAVDRSADYAPEDARVRYNQPLPSSNEAVIYTVKALADLAPARSFAARYARWLGLSPERIADLKLIATELATNSLLHTGGAFRLALWHRNGHIVCEGRDGGQRDDPLAGRRPPNAEDTAGRGLFVVNAIADLVRTHTTSTGTTTQAYLRLSPS